MIAKKLPKKQRLDILSRSTRCAICHSRERLVVDHIIPRSKGGTNHPSNLQVLCSSCNSKKKWFDLRAHDIASYALADMWWHDKGVDLMLTLSFLYELHIVPYDSIHRLETLIVSGFIGDEEPNAK